MSALLIAVPAVPLLAAPLILAVGRRLPGRGGEILVAATALALAVLLANPGDRTVAGAWFESGGFRLTVGLEANGLTRFGALVVAGVSLFVGLYGIGYMRQEAGQPRFFAELSLFVGVMLTLVLASSLILLFAAWETVGIASYLLIGFRYEEASAGPAAAKAFMMTRLGDMGFFLAWLLVLSVLGTTDIAALLAAVGEGAFSPGLLTVVAVLMLLAVIGKSAQLPLTAWLPDAMVAPTPVSALIHSATMVAAGVYLLLRLYPLFAAAPGALSAVFWVGAATALFSAVVATGAMDLKRVLAWSTSSQLGEMILAVGLGGPLAAALRFVTQASFKSALFLAAGMIDKHAGTRDLRRLSGLRRMLPVTTLAFTLGALSLAGVLPFSGQSSDDAIVAASLRSAPAASYLMLGLTFLGGVYIARGGIVVFAGGPPASRTGPGEASLPMLVGMMVLAIAAALGSLVVAVVPQLLPFGSPPETPWYWRAAVVVAGAAGLAVGGWHARRYHAASPLGSLPEVMERFLAAVTELPSLIAFAAAHGLDRVEHCLDMGAHHIVKVAWAAAAGGKALEQRLDAAARRIAGLAWALAIGSDRLEQRDFGAGGDRFAQLFPSGGEALRPLESGKLYLYTLGLLVWALGVVIVGGIAVAL